MYQQHPKFNSVPVYKSSPSWTVCNKLLNKHPLVKPVHPEVLKPLADCRSDFHPVIFDALDGTVIRSVALEAQSSANQCLWMEMTLYIISTGI